MKNKKTGYFRGSFTNFAKPMASKQRTYLAIDMKSFYASVECVDRGLNPLTTNLVVADPTRTEKTICLAVSPSLKAYGISGRARLFEVVQRVKEINALRKRNARYRFKGKSYDDPSLKAHPDWELDYIVAPPRMAHYLEVSSQVYHTYLKYVSQDDIHVYSVDEVFIDCTDYLRLYNTTAHEFAMRLIKDVLATTGITATAGIGSNLYLCKVAMDIVAKHKDADADGVRIAELDEMSYRRELWNHKPITDFWRVGHGIADRLAPLGIDTMGKIARMSIEHEEYFYKQFGVNAELLIDHAWGWEPCTMQMIKAYRPETSSYSNGQVLAFPYEFEKAKIVLKEMAESLALNLLAKQKVTSQIVLDIGYDSKEKEGRSRVHGSANLKLRSSSSRLITEAAVSIFDRIVDPKKTIRRINITAANIQDEETLNLEAEPIQLDLFTDVDRQQAEAKKEREDLQKERKLQEAQIAIKQKFGSNAILRGLDFEEGATSRERNKQIGGHKA